MKIGGRIIENVTIFIPANFTDAGRVLGLFEFRKLVEAVLLSAPVLLFSLFCLPFAITTNIVIAAVFVVPIAGFSLMGIHDYSLLDFLRVYLKWRKERAVIDINGIVSENN